MKTLFKLPFKILALPFALVFFLISLAMRFLAWVSGRVLALVSLLFAVGGAILLFQGEAYSGVGLLVMAFLVSPFGIPAFAEAVADFLHGLNSSLMCFIAG